MYDIRLRAARFVCSEEGVWADELGVSAELAGCLADHRAFFNSKERRATLAASTLPKGTVQELELAMAAAALGVRDGTVRDAARAMAARVIAELYRGKETGLASISDAGLSDALWRNLRDEPQCVA